MKTILKTIIVLIILSLIIFPIYFLVNYYKKEKFNKIVGPNITEKASPNFAQYVYPGNKRNPETDGGGCLNIEYTNVHVNHAPKQKDLSWESIHGNNKQLPFPQNLELLTAMKNDATFLTDISKDDGRGYLEFVTKFPVNVNGVANKGILIVDVPTTIDQPEDGWPILFMTDFTISDGTSQGWLDGNLKSRGGIPIFNSSLFPIVNDFFASYLMWKKYLISIGFAVVQLGETIYDIESTMVCPSCTTKDKVAVTGNQNDYCWNNGESFLGNALKLVMPQLKINELFDNNAWNSLNLKFNYNKFALSGYSVGAQTVSRMINDFPTIQGFPTISAAIMIAGGSYSCYSYTDAGMSRKMKEINEFVEYSGTKLPLHTTALPCCGRENGCCPTNTKENKFDETLKCPTDGFLTNQIPRGLTEEMYDRRIIPMSEHPPVLLMQTVRDTYAAYEAAQKYYNGLAMWTDTPGGSLSGPPVFLTRAQAFKTKGDLNGKDPSVGRHGLLDCQIPIALWFLKKYVIDTAGKQPLPPDKVYKKIDDCSAKKLVGINNSPDWDRVRNVNMFVKNTQCAEKQPPYYKYEKWWCKEPRMQNTEDCKEVNPSCD